MKKYLIIFFVFISFSASAQFNIHAGTTVSRLVGFYSSGNKKSIGETGITPTFGVGYQFLRSRIFNLSANVDYLQKGSKAGTQFKYFTLSPILKTKIPLRTFTPFINTGIYEGVLISGMNFRFNKFQTGAILGFGAEKKLLRNTIGLQMNWMPSLSRLTKTYSSMFYTGPAYYGDKTANITAFITFGGKKK